MGVIRQVRKGCVRTEGVCKNWLATIESCTLRNQTISKSVEQLRFKLGHCAMCSEGREGGFWVRLSIDREGRFFTLDGHDADRLQLREDLLGKKYVLQMRMRAADWPSDSSAAFSFCIGARVEPECRETAQQILDCLNARAREARSKSEKLGLKECLYQPWFLVMIGTNNDLISLQGRT